MSTLTLRPYQKECLDAIAAQFGAGVNRQLIRMATGTGKTSVAANLPSRLELPDNKRMLFLVHREELATQAYRSFKAWNPTRSVGVEMGADYAKPTDQMVVASVQSIGKLSSNRINRFNPADFTIITADECHHAAAKTYTNIFEYFGYKDRSDLLTLGVTATPSRSDGKGLDKIFQSIVFDMPLLHGIREGWLADIKGYRVKTKIDLDGVGVSAGELNPGELERAINVTSRNEQIVHGWLDLANGLQTVVFTPLIKHAIDLAATFRAMGIRCEAVWGDDPERQRKLDAHRKGELTVLINSKLLTEGYDDPSIMCIIDAAPCLSSAAYEQKIGRGTRIPPEIRNLIEARKQGLSISKEYLIVIDVVDNTKRHSLCNVATLFGLGEELDTKGFPISKVVEDIEEAEEAGVSTSALSDFTKLAQHIEAVDLFKVEYPAEVQSASNYKWHRTKDGSYALLLADGDYAAAVQNLMQQWCISGKVNGKHFLRTVGESFDEALQQADSMVRAFGGRMAETIAKRVAPWHKEKPKDYQLMLAKRLGIVVPEGANRGQVSEAITKRLLVLKHKG